MVLANGTLQIVAYNGTDSQVEIPEEINGIAVTSIGEGVFANSDTVTSVVVPSSVTDIAADAFDGSSIVIVADGDSYAASYAEENGIDFEDSSAVYVILGDVNSDGTVNSIDALMALRYSGGLQELSDLQIFTADVDSNGAVNSLDSLAILRYGARTAVSGQIGEEVAYTG